MTLLIRLLKIFLLLFTMAACTSLSSTDETSADSCLLTIPVWLKPPEDSAIPDPPAFGYHFANEDRSIVASAWWTDQEDYQLPQGCWEVTAKSADRELSFIVWVEP